MEDNGFREGRIVTQTREKNDRRPPPVRPSSYGSISTESIYTLNQPRNSEDESFKLDKNLVDIPGSRSPFNDLPTELIGLIIRSCTPAFPTLFLASTNDPRLHLTQICRLWRGVAFGIDELWDIYLESLPTRNTVMLIAEWFRQCSSTQIYLGGTEWLDWSEEPVHNHLWKELLPYAHRFRELHLIPLPDHSPGAMRLENLHSISLYYTATPVDAFQDTSVSSLRRLGIKEITNHFRVSPVEMLPAPLWRELTDLLLTGAIDTSTVYNILLQCKSLQSLHIDSVFSSRLHSDHAPLNLPHLKSLYITFSSPDLFDKLFMFIAPNLTSLSISHPPYRLVFLERFTMYVQNLKLTLRKFEVMNHNNITYAMASVDDLARAMPFIEHFTVLGRDIERSTLEKISKGELFPNLKAIDLDENFASGRWNALLDILVPGEPQDSRLREITIDTYQAQDLSGSSRMQEIRSQGIVVHLKSKADRITSSDVGWLIK